MRFNAGFRQAWLIQGALQPTPSQALMISASGLESKTTVPIIVPNSNRMHVLPQKLGCSPKLCANSQIIKP